MKTYIIGHTKPDTDAVVAAMALDFYTKLKIVLDMKTLKL